MAKVTTIEKPPIESPAPSLEDQEARIVQLEQELEDLPLKIGKAENALRQEADEKKLEEGYAAIEQLKLRQRNLPRLIVRAKIARAKREFDEATHLQATLQPEIEAAELELLSTESITARALIERKIKTLRNSYSHAIYNRSATGQELQQLRREAAAL